MKMEVVILLGGISPEHEVSVITGLQVIEKIDRARFAPHVIYHAKEGNFYYLGQISTRKEFLTAKKREIEFGRDKKGGFINPKSLAAKKIYPKCAFLAFHGGSGESGPIQGLLEILNIPYTSPSQEASCITMNKQLTKQVLADSNVPTVKGVSFFSKDIKNNVEKIANNIKKSIGLPVIVKPVHLGSSIGIKIAKTKIELEKYLLEGSYIDSEILAEQVIKDFVELNCAVRSIKGKIETSEIERPISQNEFLSFADKYQRGSKKTGGMASLQRELPAKIPSKVKEKIEEYARKAFKECRCKGMVRIDFMYTKDKTYLTEINPIPGSMSFYLWEATGIDFTTQITDLIEEAIENFKLSKSQLLDYKSDIVENFIKQS